jgi:hypothetical protein
LKVWIRNINFPLDKDIAMWYNLGQVGKEIKVQLDLYHVKGRDHVTRTREPTKGRSAIQQRTQRSVDSRGLDTAYRAACARHDGERRQHMVRRRNLTNPVWNGLAL